MPIVCAGPAIFRVRSGTWLALAIGMVAILVLLAWGVVSVGGWLWGQTRTLGEAAPDAARSVIAQVENTVPGAREKLAEIIPTLDETWDLVFIDADKPGYTCYYDLVMPRLRPGGIIIADNVLWDGKVTGDPEKMDRDTRGIHAFNTLVQNDQRVENVLLPIRDGLMVIRKL